MDHSPASAAVHSPTSAAVIDAGDFIGGAIARKSAAEGSLVFAGRRNGGKLTRLLQEIETADL